MKRAKTHFVKDLLYTRTKIRQCGLYRKKKQGEQEMKQGQEEQEKKIKINKVKKNKKKGKTKKLIRSKRKQIKRITSTRKR